MPLTLKTLQDFLKDYFAFYFAIILLTYARGAGVNEKRTGAYKGEGGSEIGDFTAYVLYGCPMLFSLKPSSGANQKKKKKDVGAGNTSKRIYITRSLP